jgi:hypothetical protein
MSMCSLLLAESLAAGLEEMTGGDMVRAAAVLGDKITRLVPYSSQGSNKTQKHNNMQQGVRRPHSTCSSVEAALLRNVCDPL